MDYEITYTAEEFNKLMVTLRDLMQVFPKRSVVPIYDKTGKVIFFKYEEKETHARRT